MEATSCCVEALKQAFKDVKNTFTLFYQCLLFKVVFSALSLRTYNLVPTNGESPQVSINSAHLQEMDGFTAPHIRKNAGPWLQR